MTTILLPSSISPPDTTLLRDYSRWLDFLTTTRRTIRQYDRQLAAISNRHPDLSELSDYLRACMHRRSHFFGELAIQLTGKVARLRADPADKTTIHQLTDAHPAVQSMVDQLRTSFAEIDRSYRMLFSLKDPAGDKPVFFARR